jgi:hypothetical protein
MAIYENSPSETNNTKPLFYVKPIDGKLNIRDSKTHAEQTAATIDGTLRMVRLEDDAGNPSKGIKPYEAFIMHIEDETSVYRIKCRSDINFTTSLVRGLHNFEVGDEIQLTAVEGNTAKITFANLKKKVDGEWVRVELVPSPATPKEKEELVRHVVGVSSANPLNR